MAQPKRDAFREPVQMAVETYQKQMEHFRQQVVSPTKPQRVERLGDAPADPILQSVVALMPERE